MPQERRTVVGQGATIEFQYKNWNGREHVYVIEVECFEWLGVLGHEPDSRAPKAMVLHGRVVTRDGDERSNMGRNRRRTFLVNGLREVRRVD